MSLAIVLSRLVAAVFLLGFVSGYNGVGKPCQFPNGSSGVCKIVHDCPEIIDQLKKHIVPVRVPCGFRGFDEVICCSNSDANQIENKHGQEDPHSYYSHNTYQKPIKGNGNPQYHGVQKPQKRKADKFCDEYEKNAPLSIGVKITAGSAADIGEFPHMVALGYETDRGIVFDCGGTLISDKFVITSAQCVVRKGNPAPSVVRIGAISLEGKINTQDSDYLVADVIVHPEYNYSRVYHDLALLKLKRPVSFSAFAHPACLNTDPKDPTSALTITGWGSTSLERDSKSLYLMKANVMAVSVSKCSASYAVKRNRRLPHGIEESQMCAADKKNSDSNLSADACGGDGGGPLQMVYTDNMHKIFGVTSFGLECGGGEPSVFVRISSYLDWIESRVWP